MKALRILGIETSCDETSVALLRVAGTDVEIVHHEIASQIPVHAMYGGVVPEVAARLHVAEIVALLDRAIFSQSNRKATDAFDAIAVTQGPGLATALRVGIEAGRTLAMVSKKPIVGVNHLEGHLASAWLMPENRAMWKFPILALLVSGGHSELVLMKDFCSYRVIGRSRDDAAGEAFDKTAKLMGLGYPGGPMIATHAEKGDPKAYNIPRPMAHDPSFDFSFSGLKTAVRNIWESLSKKQQQDAKVVANLCASIQEAIVDVLIMKTIAAAKKYHPKTLCIVGGVSANHHLQTRLRDAIERELPATAMLHAARGLHTDNAAMIAAAGAWRLHKGKKSNWKTMDAKPELDL